LFYSGGFYKKKTEASFVLITFAALLGEILSDDFQNKFGRNQ